VESGGIAAVVALGAGVAVATDSFISDQRSFGSKGQHQEEITPELRQMADSVVRSGGAVAAVRMTTFGEIKQTTAATAKASRPSTATQRMATAFWQFWRQMMPCGERPVVAEKMRNRMATITLTITHNYDRYKPWPIPVIGKK